MRCPFKAEGRGDQKVAGSEKSGSEGEKISPQAIPLYPFCKSKIPFWRVTPFDPVAR